jgi:hypothetical protein
VGNLKLEAIGSTAAVDTHQPAVFKARVDFLFAIHLDGRDSGVQPLLPTLARQNLERPVRKVSSDI